MWSLCRVSNVWKRLIPYLGWHDFVTFAAVCTISMFWWGTSTMGDVAEMTSSDKQLYAALRRRTTPGLQDRVAQVVLASLP